MKNLTISIPTPCSEKWESFKPTSTGGFCGSCNKNVIDFTGRSDQEIFEFFKNKPAHSCGRFRPQQLKSYSSFTPDINPGFPLLKAGMVSLLMLIISKPASSQDLMGKPRIEAVVQDPTTCSAVKPDSLITLKGRILDETDAPFPGASIVVRGRPIGAVADLDGRFELSEKVKEDDKLIISFIGYESLVVSVKQVLQDDGVIKMSSDCLALTGTVAVVEVYEPKRVSFWTRLKNIF